MFCQYCGEKISDDANYCSKCGGKVANDITQVKMKQLRCQSCGGELSVNGNQQLLLCPYCGSKELIIESDAIRVAKITSDTYRDIEFEKQKTEIQIRQMDIEEKNRQELRAFYSKVIGLLMILGSIGLFVLCVEFQHYLGSGARFFMTVFCFAMFILGICVMCRKRS